MTKRIARRTEAICAREHVLIPAIKAGGLEEVRIIEIRKDIYIIGLEIQRTGQHFFLSTRRLPNQPREFKKIDVAVKLATKFFGVLRFTVTRLIPGNDPE